LVSYVREKEHQAKEDVIQKFANKSTEAARDKNDDKNQINSSSSGARKDPGSPASSKASSDLRLPTSMQLIQVQNVLPFLCNIEDLNEGTLLRPITPGDETIDPQSARASSA